MILLFTFFVLFFCNYHIFNSKLIENENEIEQKREDFTTNKSDIFNQSPAFVNDVDKTQSIQIQ